MTSFSRTIDFAEIDGASVSNLDNGPLINSTIALLAARGNDCGLRIPPGEWKFSTQVVNPSGIPIFCEGVLLWTGSGQDAWVEGSDGVSVPVFTSTTSDFPSQQPSYYRIRRNTQDVTDVYAGLVFKNLNCKTVYARIDSFFYGIELHGKNNGCAYNNIFAPVISGCVKAIRLHASGTGWCNSNRLYIGTIQSRPKPTYGGFVSGVLYDNEAAGEMNDNIVFQPSFELTNLGGPTTAFETRLTGGLASVSNNKLFGGRNEGTDYILSGQGYNRISTIGTTNGTTTLTVTDATGIIAGAFLTSSSGDIPADTYIKSISGLTITLSAAATGSNAGQTITVLDYKPAVINNFYHFSLLATYNQFDTFTGVSGETKQDGLALQLNVIGSPSVEPVVNTAMPVISRFGKENVVTSAGGLQAPARGMFYSLDGTFAVEKAGTVSQGEITLGTANVGIGLFLDVSKVNKDVMRRLYLKIEQGDGTNGGYIGVVAIAADGTTILDSFADVSFVMRSFATYASSAYEVTKKVFYSASQINSTGKANSASIAFGPNVAYLWVGLLNMGGTSPSFKAMELLCYPMANIKTLANSLEVSLLGATKPLLDTNDPVSTAIPTGTTYARGQVARARLPAVGSPYLWVFDSTDAWVAGANL